MLLLFGVESFVGGRRITVSWHSVERRLTGFSPEGISGEDRFNVQFPGLTLCCLLFV